MLRPVGMGRHCQAAPSWEKPPHLYPFEDSVSQVPLENPPQSRKTTGHLPPPNPPPRQACPEPLHRDHIASYTDLKPDPVPSSLLTGALSSVLSCTPDMLDMHRIGPSSGPLLPSPSVVLLDHTWTTLTGPVSRVPAIPSPLASVCLQPSLVHDSSSKTCQTCSSLCSHICLTTEASDFHVVP